VVSGTAILPDFPAVAAQLSLILVHFPPVVPHLVAVVPRARLRHTRRGRDTQSEHHPIQHDAFHRSLLRPQGAVPATALDGTAAASVASLYCTLVGRLEPDPQHSWEIRCSIAIAGPDA
jgi:hypothetical protein